MRYNRTGDNFYPERSNPYTEDKRDNRRSLRRTGDKEQWKKTGTKQRNALPLRERDKEKKGSKRSAGKEWRRETGLCPKRKKTEYNISTAYVCRDRMTRYNFRKFEFFFFFWKNTNRIFTYAVRPTLAQYSRVKNENKLNQTVPLPNRNRLDVAYRVTFFPGRMFHFFIFHAMTCARAFVNNNSIGIIRANTSLNNWKLF